MPWPPPMHKVTMPRFRPSRRIEWTVGCQHRTGGADRVAMRNGAALDVDDVLGQAKLARTTMAIAAKAR